MLHVHFAEAVAAVPESCSCKPVRYGGMHCQLAGALTAHCLHTADGHPASDTKWGTHDRYRLNRWTAQPLWYFMLFQISLHLTAQVTQQFCSLLRTRCR
jgi:hypothetical protein